MHHRAYRLHGLSSKLGQTRGLGPKIYFTFNHTYMFVYVMCSSVPLEAEVLESLELELQAFESHLK